MIKAIRHLDPGGIDVGASVRGYGDVGLPRIR